MINNTTPDNSDKNPGQDNNSNGNNPQYPWDDPKEESNKTINQGNRAGDNEPEEIFTEKEVSKWKTGTELILAAEDTIPCLVEPLIPKTGIVIFGGSSDTGKSTILRQLVIKIVSGADDFLGWKLCAEHKRALVIATEDDKNAISLFLKKQAAGIPPEKLNEIHYLFEYEPGTLVRECIEFVKSRPCKFSA